MGRVPWRRVVVRDAAERHLVVRLSMVVAGLTLNGVAITMLIRAELGLGPWDVLHQGLAARTGLGFGLVVILVGVAALLPWWPLRERPGVGTVLNVFVAGIVIDRLLTVTGPATQWWSRGALMTGGVALFALGQGMYLAPRLGAGPREGLMTGINRRFGISIRLARFQIEVAILALGIALGGSAGLGTIVFTLAIGPLVQAGMRLCGYRDRTAPEAAGA
ncbi:YczE/YyaS/YitT family protein [Spongiactinospora gelatinilytica]|nr:hypothetical protein [Spongiactinospora gelatinilytica]